MIIRRLLLTVLVAAPFALNAQSFPNGAVSSADPMASEAGATVLRNGGNAMDAAVATYFMLAVTYPAAGNIGGGGFMVIRTADGVASLDFRETAPSAAKRDMYIDASGIGQTSKSQRGGLAAGVPGSVKGMAAAHARYGSQPWADLLEPAIRAAEDGFRIPAGLAASLNGAASSLKEFGAASFLRADGNPWKEGDFWRQPDLAATLRRIARSGAEGFYTGETADLIVRTMAANEGIITHGDLMAYSEVWRTPVRTEWKGHVLHQMPLPSSGSVVMPQILRWIEPYDLAETGHGSVETVHLLSEAMRRSFADRNHYLGDPDFVDVPLNGLLDPDYLRERWATFDPGHASSSAEIGYGLPESDETTHFSVVDANGNAVAITTTLNGSYGSFVEVAGAGFLLNNEMDDFSIQPGVPNMFGLLGTEANAIAPGKRMLSSMSPTIVEVNGHVRMVLGAAGGPRIITAVLHGFLNGAVYGMSAEGAIRAGRFHHQHQPDMITVDVGMLSDDALFRLRVMGHTVEERSAGLSRAHFIFIRPDGTKDAAADPRGFGTGAGH